jgi:ATP-binding cassette subfamily B multidrug efflux pump
MMHGGRHRALEVEAIKPKSVGATLARFWKYFRAYWFALLLVAALIAVGVWAQVLTPELTGQAVDCYLTPATSRAFAGFASLMGGQSEAAASNCWYGALPENATAEDIIAGLGGLILVIAGLYVIGAVVSGLQFYVMRWAGQKVLKQIRVDLFQHLLRLPLSYYSEHEAGELMSRITNDTDTIQQVVQFALVNVVQGTLLLVWIMVNMLAKSVPYALLSFIVVPFMIAATVWFSRQARLAYRRARVEIGEVTADLQESIAGVREAQAFSREDENITEFRASNAANRDANIRAAAYTSVLGPVLGALGYVSIAIVVGAGGYAILGDGLLFGTSISLGLVVTFLSYVQRFNHPIQQIAVLWTNIQSAVAGGERIFELIDTAPDITDRPDARPMPPIQGQVEFTDVDAWYKEGEAVLKNINLTAKPGKTVAIVGPTGAGKTTLANLIPRFYDVKGGSVKIDGSDVRDVTRASLRAHIGIVLQDTFLFSDTVMNNIRYGRPEALDAEVIEAARLAHADNFIERLPEGYQTVLGERGSGLSQGQRQLIAIARAILSDAQILILDEATSSVDTRTERLIQAALRELLQGHTSFVIAHRLSTIRNADQVLVLNEGEIIERGTHEELLAARGFYYDLYMSQFRREEPAPSDDGREAVLHTVKAPGSAD